MSHAKGDIRGEMKSELSAIRAENSDLRGEIKVIAAQQEMLHTKIGWYISFLGIAMTAVVALVQILLK